MLSWAVQTADWVYCCGTHATGSTCRLQGLRITHVTPFVSGLRLLSPDMHGLSSAAWWTQACYLLPGSRGSEPMTHANACCIM
jgi:hypothetical protein